MDGIAAADFIKKYISSDWNAGSKGLGGGGDMDARDMGESLPGVLADD